MASKTVVVRDLAEQMSMDYMAIKGREEFLDKYKLDVPVGSTTMAAMIRKYAEVQNDRLQLIARQLGACTVCWTQSWAPCDPGHPNACQDLQNPSMYVCCQMCEAVQALHERQDYNEQKIRLEDALNLLERVSVWLYQTAAQVMQAKVNKFLEACGRKPIRPTPPGLAS